MRLNVSIMFVNTSKLLLTLTTTISLLGCVSAVDIKQYRGINCTGNKRLFRQVPANTCLRSNVWFHSQSCQNCNSKQWHSASRKPAPANNVEESGCGIIISEKRGGKNNCITKSDLTVSIGGILYAYSASSWYHAGKRRGLIDTPNEEEDDQLQDVTSDLIEIDGRWFQINDTVPQVYLDELDVLWESNITADAIPAHLSAFETWAPDEE
ncbi:hypothetical protein AUP68_01023 [Ilyonectria robusta]